MERVVIVGASLAGVRCAQSLRAKGFEGTITLYGDETVLPYDRPPLSKQVLAGEWEPERIPLADAATFDKLDLDLRLGVRVSSVDEVGAYDHLVIATGARPRQIDGGTTLRTLDDALALKRALESKPRVVVVGAGFIGAEVAATARGYGLDVTVLEALPQPLSRALGEEVGAALGRLHVAKDVTLRCGVGVSSIEVDGVHLADGSVVAADLVVVGIGVVPNVEWLEGSGAELRDGVVCDERLAVVGVPNAWAAGDIVRWPHSKYGDIRIEHWTNAVEQGQHVAACITGDEKPFATVPFVWSDQYEHRIQIVGLPLPTDEIRVVHGSLDAPPWAVEHVRDGAVMGVTGVDAVKVVMPYRRNL